MSSTSTEITPASPFRMLRAILKGALEFQETSRGWWFLCGTKLAEHKFQCEELTPQKCRFAVT